MEFLVVVVLGLLAIAAAAGLGPRLGVAAPLLLVVAGLVVSLLPFVPAVEIEPEWILAGVLPPLLYSASVSMPAMDFRREFAAISGLSVVLVVATAVLLGGFFAWVLPDLGLAWGIALGAIVSPTDAVATSIVKRLGVSPRVVALLEGEGLLNDATALVVLRAAIAGAAASVSLWRVAGEFLFAVVVAVVVGFVVGRVNLVVRARVADPAINTVLSFTVPFLASVPADALGASGLVAAVVAGLVTGRGAARVLSPQHRLSDTQNWRTVEAVLEGAVFLVMGLEVSAIVGDVRADDTGAGAGVGTAVAVAAGALLLTIVVRAVYVGPLLAGIALRTRRGAQMRPMLTTIQGRLADPATAGRAFEDFPRRVPASPRRAAGLGARMRRLAADIDYFLAQPLGWREGGVVVWAGMRGAVTLAAAQTLPDDTPDRSLLVLIAFLVAVGSLLLQGCTLPRLVRVLGSARVDPLASAERGPLLALLEQAAAAVPADPAGRADDGDRKRHTLAVIDAQRQALLDARDDGAFSAGALDSALAVLDADQISLELRGAPASG